MRHAVIMAGGSGTRLWPLSRQKHPKQLLRIFEGQSLLRRSFDRLAALLDVPLMQAAQNIVPVAVTSAESVEQLRSWASGRCLSAETTGIYARRESSGKKTRRKIPRDPSVN